MSWHLVKKPSKYSITVSSIYERYVLRKYIEYDIILADGYYDVVA